MTANNAVVEESQRCPAGVVERTDSAGSPNYPPLKCHGYLDLVFDFISFQENVKKNCVTY